MAVPSLLQLPREIVGQREEQQFLSEYEQLPDSDPSFSSDAFRINFMKILPCSKRYCHDWTSCPFCHHGEKARRRDPKVMPYTGIACPDMKKDGACVRGELCPYAHNVFEYWLHPTRYRTQLCNDGTHCKRRVCFFAHTASELRVPDSKPFVNPQALAAATAAAAARRTSNITDTAYGQGQGDLAERLALLQLQNADGMAGNQAQRAALLRAQPQAMMTPSNDSSNAQIIELLTALLRQKQLEQQNAVYPVKEGQFSNDQLMALYQSMGLMAGQGQPQQAQNQMMAGGGGKAIGSVNPYTTPRSSLDMSGLQGATPSDYSTSCRSSFETPQDAHRISLEGSRTDSSGFGTSLHSYASSNARLSLDSYAPQRTSYDAGVGASYDKSPQELATAIEGGPRLGTGGVIQGPNGPLGMDPSSGGYVNGGAYPLSGAAAAASAAAALNSPSLSNMTTGSSTRRASFDAAPGSYGRLSGDHSYLHKGNGYLTNIGNGYVPAGLPGTASSMAPVGPADLNGAAFRSVSLPDGVSKSRLAALNLDRWTSGQYTHLPAVTEGVPFLYKASPIPGTGFDSVAQNGYNGLIMAQDASVVVPTAALRPQWNETSFSQAGPQMQATGAAPAHGPVSDEVCAGSRTFSDNRTTFGSFFANSPLLPAASSSHPVSAAQLPETEEVLHGISSV